MKAYWEGDGLALYLGDCRDVLPALGVSADLVLADPPYGETSLPWDHWPDAWLDVAARMSRSLWCFGSLRMFLLHGPEFAAASWKLSQDVIWEKHNGTGFAADRFKRVHETITHWYRGDWRHIHHEVPTEQVGRRDGGNRGYVSSDRGAHVGAIGGQVFDCADGRRLLRSVRKIRGLQGLHPIHPTEKPHGVVDPLIRYACPPGGLVVDPFAGSGSTLDAARSCGRRAIGVEGHEPYAEAAARRLDQMTLEVG